MATRTRTATASDLYYSCNVDGVSEVQIADAVQSINYSIDNFITNILDGVKSKLSYHKTSPRKRRRRDIPTEPSTGTLRQYLLESRLSASDRDLVADFILHDLVSSLVHKHFFKGGTFFGVGKETLHEDLETMFSKLVADGKFLFYSILIFFLKKRSIIFFDRSSVNNFSIFQKNRILLLFNVGVL